MIYHLTLKRNGRKTTVATCDPGDEGVLADAEALFRDSGYAVHLSFYNVERGDVVCRQKNWKGYHDDCPHYKKYPTVKGEGAPQYTFAPRENEQLALL